MLSKSLIRACELFEEEFGIYEEPTMNASEREIATLRRQQTRKVMPLIGPLLDAWDLVSNDIKSDPGLDYFSKQIGELYRAMED